MKKYKIHLFSLVAALGLSSCDDYLDINQSPNNPTYENVTPNLALSGAITQPYRSFSTMPNALGNLFMNSWGGNVNSVTGIYTVEFDLNIDNSFYSRIWENLFLTTLGLSNIQNFPAENYDNHKAIAKIMKTFYFQYLVDLYGDMPYSQAHNPLNPTPVYDNAQTIYRDLVVQLEDAIDMIDNAPAGTTTVGLEDPVFKGNMANWKKLANTIKLRLLIRESGVAASQTYLNAEFAELAGADFITTDATVNPGYSNANNDRQNPFYNTYGYQINETTERPSYSSTVATDNAIKSLNGSKYGTPDGRLGRLFKQNGGSWAGVIQGQTGIEAPDNLANLGPGLIKNSAQDGYIFTAAESYFLQAEAVQRGYLSGSAENLFITGIEKSFQLLGVPATGVGNITDYKTAINSAGADPRISWLTSTNKIETIMTQKWIALMGINGIESWIEYTRTGFPVTDLALTATRPAKPVRLMYPNSEYTANGNNVPSQSQNDAFNNKIFWALP
ncbi:SusD/RagB family nutrient-binding outer membrane lipoprotein [Flavobacterium supellecticarium]|uniref:SusD/RagB family nutrient-binding outer membrane lipoprotein n=1 Tax=Flavobacterium supellecticarium TaxID=2565924 RepID=A0A4S4A091_9FLAO|nr:SusD/RagB family nutrient-binding outer membrane lipoprotein [Flavobacterium supellecticarium]THF51309.1 SusD/RagB family nutrient-binding outer membrane lipoprotein [Flavobacterium supellecticarium]